jgi:hypothetical protein
MRRVKVYDMKPRVPGATGGAESEYIRVFKAEGWLHGIYQTQGYPMAVVELLLGEVVLRDVSDIEFIDPYISGMPEGLTVVPTPSPDDSPFWPMSKEDMKAWTKIDGRWVKKDKEG